MRIVLVLVGIVLLVACDARAEFFKYKDSSGAVVITDKLENVPQKYRSQLKVVWDEDLEAKDPLKRREAAARAAQEKKDREQGRPAEKLKQSDGKRLVITVDEATGELIRRME